MILSSIKNVCIPFVVCVFVALSFYPNTTLKNPKYSTDGIDLDYNFSEDIAMSLLSKNSTPASTYTPNLGKSFEGFKEALAFKESGGNYFVINTHGYLGKYQFGRSTLKTIGIYNTRDFLNNPELQEKAFLVNAMRNKWILRHYIDTHVGKTISGVKITESGILASAHLAGPGNVKRFLRSYGKSNFADAYGSTVKYYMAKFSGYDTSLLESKKNAKVKLDS